MAAKKAVSHKDMANALRVLAMDAVEAAQSGHPGLPMGAADVATVLFTKFMRFDPRAPRWADRDRFVLSAGHGSMLLYALLYLLGYEDMTLEELKNFRQLGSKTPGHPEYGSSQGVEVTTGPLGQGLGAAVGMALGERLLNADFGDDLVSHRTYVLISDGDLMEGISHEVISLAGHLGLSRLIALYDDNEVSIDGPTSLADSGDVQKRFEAAGWSVCRIDGHDSRAIEQALEVAQGSSRPSLIACRTKIGYGAPSKEGTAATHGAPLGAKEVAGARKTLGWTAAAPFKVPSGILDDWRLVGLRRGKARRSWERCLADLSEERREEFERRLRGDLPANLRDVFGEMKKKAARSKASRATRACSGGVLQALVEHVPEVVGGSADLTESNNVKGKNQQVISAHNYAGRFLHYGVREHGMAAVMNGLALHGGFVPYGGSFLAFTDYCRPAMRLAALMGLRVIYVMTHDSIGLGEDGPTHQPIEHLASLRAMPGIKIFRPADMVETVECWEAALESQHGPSVLVLTRQGVPTVRHRHREENLCARGGYQISGSAGAEVTLVASGSEVSVALAAQALLQKDDIPVSVVSMPCFELFCGTRQGVSGGGFAPEGDLCRCGGGCAYGLGTVFEAGGWRRGYFCWYVGFWGERKGVSVV